MKEAADGLHFGRVDPRFLLSGHLLSHSNSFGFEMEKDAAGCRAYHLNYIVGAFNEKIEIPQNGTYTFAIRNNSDVDIEVTGYVNY